MVFNFMTLNGYFKGPGGDISWHSHSKEEEGEFAGEMAQMGGTLLFGRVTYEMMVAYWPTPAAKKDVPAVADGMNKSEKIVFSRTLKKADWQNARVVNGDIVEEVRRLKGVAGGGSAKGDGGKAAGGGSATGDGGKGAGGGSATGGDGMAASDMCILGSGSIVTQLAAAGLIDEYMFMVDPLILGEGTPVCKGMGHALNLKLKKTRTFKSGTLLLTYEPIAK
jgi:dihydrofolate reductase